MNICKGIKISLGHLTDRDKRLIIKLMARASEASYRRGLVHGVYFVKNGELSQDPGRWRYRVSLDRSPHGQSGKGPAWMTSVHRLFCENMQLHRVGLREPYPKAKPGPDRGPRGGG